MTKLSPSKSLAIILSLLYGGAWLVLAYSLTWVYLLLFSVPLLWFFQHHWRLHVGRTHPKAIIAVQPAIMDKRKTRPSTTRRAASKQPTPGKTNHTWTLQHRSGEITETTLSPHSFVSSPCLVLQFKDPAYSIVIFRDALSPMDYSDLRCQLRLFKK